MKSSLLITRLASAILLLSVIPHLSAQTVVFSEDFSGFTTGTHSTPSTYDVSGALDTKTGAPGWTGFKVYSAGGEIKLGTSDIPGWIETPLIDFSGCTGDLFIRFDIARWPDDAASVQVSLNGSAIGNTITPTDEFQTIEMPLTEGTTAGKIKFESLAKRFFLDNILVVVQSVTGAQDYELQPDLNLYPNPAGDMLNIDNILTYNKLEIYDLYGKVVSARDISGADRVTVILTGLPPGLYILRLVSDKSYFTMRFARY